MNTDTRLMRLEVVRLQKAHVVCCDDRHTAAAGKRDGCGDVSLLLRTTKPLQLDVKTVAEQLEPRIERLFGIALTRIDERTADIAFRGARQSDQPAERFL